ncbi:MAG: prolyl oligopeptidase family serine peptidase [Butyrivibrio sp.]|uniref:prolyl oligopeptidase family serine peptidase n=1 Tax=Butyrivibrio sp. TaxID=28121 RepID=UPI0025BC8789|nr:prolyl oligopeptidase family serine peptidase [Butyrivibrio sp.]MBQ6589738.1 prolyl oligopeptidase family serine peptidase [Butyrivibrio sp.]
MKRKVLVILLCSALSLGGVACGAVEVGEVAGQQRSIEDTPAVSESTEGNEGTEQTTDKEENTVSKELTASQRAVIVGQDWGPAVTKTILKFDEKVKETSVSAEDFKVMETKEMFNWSALAEGSTADPTQHIEFESERKVVDAYTCDENGEKTSDSEYVAVELYYSPDEGSPFCYDLFKGNNTICNPYNLAVTLADGQTLTAEAGDEVVSVTVNDKIDFDNAFYPQLLKTDISLEFTGAEGHTIHYASYEPEADGAKHPLVIWLHGAGEGGNDPRLNTLGNEVTALYSDEFQKVMGGAYVLAPQCPTFWMQYDESGNWMDNKGVDSIYLHDLKELIDAYVADHENVDADRIIIGGCSNGGYMTMDMILNYPDYFAAAYPICEAYNNSGITDEQLASIKDLPTWFIYAKNDTTVDPTVIEEPTLARLNAIGANVHTSVFDDVHDTSDTYKGQDGNAYQYMGHWSWIYFFNNECEDNGVNMWQWMSEQHK